jgi:glycosyltransferase involved in cell wall biosynthesis
MRILVLDQFGELGGGQQCLLELIPGLIGQDWEVHVAAPPDGPLLAACRSAGATCDAIRCGPYSRGTKSARDVLRFARELPGLRGTIARLADRCRADLVYVNGPRLLPAAAWASRGRRPLLLHCHSFLGRRSAAWPVRYSLRWASAAVVASCKFVARPLARWCAHPPEIVYNGVAEPLLAHGEFAPGETWRIGVVGRIAPEKGQAVFLAAARILWQEFGNCRFVVCGAVLSRESRSQAYGREVRRLAEGLPVEFTGWQQPADSVLAGLDVVAVPSAPGEANPRVILEAYAAGVPVVAYASGGIPEVLADGRTGLLVQQCTPGALAERIRELISGPRERLWEMSRRAREEWSEKYTLDRFRRRMAEIIAGQVH